MLKNYPNLQTKAVGRVSWPTAEKTEKPWVLDMSNSYRIEKIYDLLLVRKKVSVNELAEMFHVTPTTIRRDLIAMEEKGLAGRMRGFAVAISDTAREAGVNLFVEEKRRIAEAAKKYVKNGMSLVLDAGTTVETFAETLVEDGAIDDLDIVTNSLAIGLKTGRHFRVAMPGGIVLSNSACLVGMDVESFFSNIHVDVAFLGTTGIEGSDGLTVSYPLHLTVKKQMVACARKRIALLDSSKFSFTGIFTFCNFSDLDVMITVKTDSNEKDLEEIASRGVELVLV